MNLEWQEVKPVEFRRAPVGMHFLLSSGESGRWISRLRPPRFSEDLKSAVKWNDNMLPEAVADFLLSQYSLLTYVVLVETETK